MRRVACQHHCIHPLHLLMAEICDEKPMPCIKRRKSQDISENGLKCAIFSISFNVLHSYIYVLFYNVPADNPICVSYITSLNI
jgi:hypothetical protein